MKKIITEQNGIYSEKPDTDSLKYGDIIYHYEYGFGIMKDLPTFGNMEVAGISKSCIEAHKLMIALYKEKRTHAIEFAENILQNKYDCFAGTETHDFKMSRKWIKDGIKTTSEQLHETFYPTPVL